MIFNIRQLFLKSMFFISMLLFFYPILAFSQQVNPDRSHAISDLSTTIQPNVPDTLTIIAVRVEFQQDENRLTSGDGTFDTENLSYLDNPVITIDPLPHNSLYFESHLQFAKNYFEEVSSNQMTVQYRVLPETYQLPQKMEAYSPTGETFTNEKVANLAQDTWETVEQYGGFSTSRLDPEKTAFIIFHAGVGRDIELVGTSLDKTPQDIPSLFLGQNSLSKLLNDPNFEGFDINDGAFQITNSAILPRTLSRTGEDISGEQFVLQLSINGLLCASIGSYLGLPDLFNTETGSSGIGRFGLMDGESFFSYHGLFPPEPSAWEKTYLGWQSPFPITTARSTPISLPAASFHQSNSIAKYELSKSEYFLVENRHRNPGNSGVTLTFQQQDGTIQTKQFDNHDEAFVNQSDEFTETLIPGVVTDVTNFDWSLPGGVDSGPDESTGTSDDRLLNGGILIWHIDEAVIQNELTDQTVNANPQRRGVDLEEADGAQDIGRAVSEDFSTQGRGTAFDFWWDGNNASVVTLEGDTLSFYENRFGPDTRPSNKSNSGAPSFFEFYDFSDNQPTASFRIRPRSTEKIQQIPLPVDALPDQLTFTNRETDYFSSYPLGLSFFKTQTDSFLIIPSQQSTHALNLNENSDNPIFNFQSGQPQQSYLGNSLIVGQAPLTSQIELTSWQWDGGSWNTVWITQAEANKAFLSSINDQTLLLDFTDQQIDISNGTLQTPLPNARQRSATLNGQFTVLTGNNLVLHPENNSTPVTSIDDRHYTGALRLTSNRTGFYFLSENELIVFEPGNFNQPTTIIQNTPMEWPAMSDINNDGRIDFIYVNKETNALEARNINGAMLSYFPIQPPEGSAFVGTPLITKPDQSEKAILYITAQDSLSMNIYAYSAQNETVEGFPLYVGNASAQENSPIHPIIRDKILYAISHRGELKAWLLDSVNEVLWESQYGNMTYNKVTGNLNVDGKTPSNSESILVEEETYNWPNPAEDHTHLRFQTSDAGFVDVKIITTGGNVVFDERYEASGSVPEEHRISTKHWSSGVYFGMITATINGEKAHKMIKIAVVH
jgi:hypothetical protein